MRNDLTEAVPSRPALLRSRTLNFGIFTTNARTFTRGKKECATHAYRHLHLGAGDPVTWRGSVAGILVRL